MKISNKAKVWLRVSAGVSLVTLSFGVVFGLSAATFRISYVDLFNKTNRKNAKANNSYDSQNIESKWNVKETDDLKFVDTPNEQVATSESRKQRHQPFFNKATYGKTVGTGYYDYDDSQTETKKWSDLDPINDKDTIEPIMNARYNMNQFVLDGKDHTALDHSFNQSLYTGIIRYIHGGMKEVNGQWVNGIYDKDLLAPTNANKITIKQNIARASKPSQDNSIFLQLAYEEASKNSGDLPCTIQCAGYNHVSPLSDYVKYLTKDSNGKYYINFDGKIKDAAIFLYDGTVANNQNIASNLFRADQSSFLCGIATCCYFLKNINIFYSGNEPMSIGVYGGVNIPTVSIFMGGIERGVELYNHYILPNIVDEIINDIDSEKNQKNFPELVSFIKNRNTQDRQKLINDLSVQIISLQKTESYFTGSFVQSDAIGMSKELLNRKANAIICVAGPQGVDTAQEINCRGSNCIMIGVDSAMELSDFQRSWTSSSKTNDPQELDDIVKNGIFKFSAIKDICYFVQKQIELYTQDLNWDISDKNDKNKPDIKRSICSIGYNTNGNILNGGSSISDSGWYYLSTALQYLKLKSTDGVEQKFAYWWDDDDFQQDFLDGHNINQSDATDLFKNVSFEQLCVVPISSNDDSSENNVAVSLKNNYAMYLKYLGEIINKYGLDFVDDETVEDAGFSPILKWLNDNMYFTC